MGLLGDYLKPMLHLYMVIKYLTKFESIFYALLLSNLTGYFLVPTNLPSNLFENEPFIDIEKISWQQILNEHNKKFGEIRWFVDKTEVFYDYKKYIDSLLANNLVSHHLIINSLNSSIKFGPKAAVLKIPLRQHIS